MDFDERLKSAIDRGRKQGDAKAQDARRDAFTEEEMKRLHSVYQLQLSEHIESCVGHLPNHFPGFRYESMFGERGWGAACSRDDLQISSTGKRSTYYSRYEMTIRPYSSSLHVLELSAKGTVNNKEVFTRTHYEKLDVVDPDKFIEMIDAWVVRYAEMYSSG